MKKVGTYWQDKNNRIFKIVGFGDLGAKRIHVDLITPNLNSNWCFLDEMDDDTLATEAEFILESIK